VLGRLYSFPTASSQIHCSDIRRCTKSALHLAPSLIRASPAAALAGLSCISKAVWMTPSKAAREAGHLQHREALCRAVEHKWCYERKQKANEDPIEHKW